MTTRRQAAQEAEEEGSFTAENVRSIMAAMQQSQTDAFERLLSRVTRQESPSPADQQCGNFTNCTSRFSGDESEDAEAFIDALESYKEGANVSEVNALRGLSMLLVGDAATWWRSVKPEVKSWPEALQYIRSAYGDRRPPSKIYLEIFNQPQLEGERTDKFVARTRALLNRIPVGDLTEKAKIDMTYGLLLRRIRKRFRREEVTTFGDLILKAQAIEDSFSEVAAPAAESSRESSRTLLTGRARNVAAAEVIKQNHRRAPLIGAAAAPLSAAAAPLSAAAAAVPRPPMSSNLRRSHPTPLSTSTPLREPEKRSVELRNETSRAPNTYVRGNRNVNRDFNNTSSYNNNLGTTLSCYGCGERGVMRADCTKCNAQFFAIDFTPVQEPETFPSESQLTGHQYQRPSPKVRVASLSLTPTPRASYSPQERDECPPPARQPPPPPVPWKLKFTVLTVSVLTTYCTIYAKKSPEARDWLSIHAPWFDDFIAIVYEENMTHKQFIQKCIDDLIDYKDRPRPCSTDSADCIQDAPLRERIECPEQPIVTNKEGKECSIPPPPVVTTDVCELEECLREHGDEAYFGYMTARDACKVYNDLVAATMTDFCVHRFDELGPAGEERQDLVEEHATNAGDSWASLNSLEKYLDCGGLKGTKEQIENTKLLFNEYQAKIKNMHADYAWEADRAAAVQSKVEMVKQLLDNYMEENQTMFPSVDYKSKKPQISEDIDLFLIHSLKYMKKLRPILEEYAEAISLRADRGVESLPVPAEDWEKRQRAQIIPNKFKEKQWELELAYRKRLDILKAYNDKVLKESLKNQNDRQQESFKNKMEAVEREATAQLNKMVANAVAAQKKVFNTELAEMGAKLKEVEKRLQARLKADRELKRSKDLYAAGSSLLAATKKGEVKVNISEELKALEKAAGNDDALVLTVLNSIPQEVRKEGLVPESVLRDRYHSMEQVALRVALVEQEGAPLPVYIMSYVQSLLLFMKVPGIPQEDVDRPLRENMDDLDTFDILRRARYWIQQGNMAAALRYVSSLEGASRAAAAHWRADAEALVAARQAAEAVLAHATALALQYV